MARSAKNVKSADTPPTKILEQTTKFTGFFIAQKNDRKADG